jgi:hypothetical protein
MAWDKHCLRAATSTVASRTLRFILVGVRFLSVFEASETVMMRGVSVTGGGSVHRLASMLATSLLCAAAALGSGCANDTSSSLLTGSIGKQTAAPSSGAANGEPLARSARVASTAARAQICGLAFDPAKLRASYLAYESKQGLDGAQLSMIEKSYDTTLSTIATQRAAIADRCSAKQVTRARDRNAEFSEKYKDEIKAELQRYVAGSFTPDEKKPNADGPSDAKAFWKDQDDG